MLSIDVAEVVRRVIKALVEGLAVAAAAYYIPNKKPDIKQILVIALTAAASLAVLDYLAPALGGHARQGAGFGIGLGLVGTKLPIPGVPGLV